MKQDETKMSSKIIMIIVVRMERWRPVKEMHGVMKDEESGTRKKTE